MDQVDQNLDKFISAIEEELSSKRQLQMKEISENIFINNQHLDRLYHENNINLFNDTNKYNETVKVMDVLYIENIKLKHEKETLEYLNLEYLDNKGELDLKNPSQLDKYIELGKKFYNRQNDKNHIINKI